MRAASSSMRSRGWVPVLTPRRLVGSAAVPWGDGLALALLLGVERDLRHASRPHAGARQDRGDAGAARAAAATRRAAADGAWMGDRAAARGRRRAGGGAGPARPRGVRRAQR